MEDIEAFSATYRARLAEAELSKSIPENVSLEVSFPSYFLFFSFAFWWRDVPLQNENLNEVTGADVPSCVLDIITCMLVCDM